VLIMNPANRMLASVDGRVRPISVTSELAVRVAKERELTDVTLESADSSLVRMSVEDRQWVADGAFRLLVPMFGSDGGLLGVVGLGEKRSELPFSQEDRLLLTTIADSAAITLELLIRREIRPIFPTESAPEHEFAMECGYCGSLYPSGILRCTCNAPLMEAVVPYILLGKFRFVKQVGRGGMGVVYRALDLMLDRHVAVKALPRASPEYSIWLRKEARAMAAVGHPNLALIFGAETWRGVPMLIFEFLEGGTLADRLQLAPLSLNQVVDLGMVLADVLQHIHAKGVLHRDIKPSNIGYSEDGQLKLMDFGLAHILKETPREEWIHQDLPTLPEILTESITKGVDLGITRLKDGKILGTPLYLSPEAVDGAPADISFDLWATATVLYEALAGKNPFRRATLQESLESIALTEIPDIRDQLPDCPDEVANFFSDALAKDPRRRPPTAKDLKSRLEGVGPRQVVF